MLEKQVLHAMVSEILQEWALGCEELRIEISFITNVTTEVKFVEICWITFPNKPCGGFLSHGGTPSSHPF